MYKIELENGTIETNNVALAVETLISNDMMDVPTGEEYNALTAYDK